MPNSDATEAWLYFCPLLLTQLTRQADEGLELDAWKHAVRAQDADTIDSHAWLDLTGGPVQLAVPDMVERYYVVQAVEEWSSTFATLGTRTTGNRAGSFVFASADEAAASDWRAGTTVISCPTSHVRLVLRIQRDDAEGADAIARLRGEFTLTGSGETEGPPRIPPEVKRGLAPGVAPVQALLAMDEPTFFGWASELWGRPEIGIPAADADLVGRLAPLGLHPGIRLDWGALTDGQRAAFDGARARALRKLRTQGVAEAGVVADGWYYPRDNWYRVDGHRVHLQQPTHYTLRAALALEAPEALPLQEAVRVSAGVPPVGGAAMSGAGGAAMSGAGGARYTIRFEPGQLPPVDAFWSLSVYDSTGRVPIGRNKLGSEDAFERDPDGAVTVELSNARPERGEANWLQIPAADFTLAFRAYCPRVPFGPAPGPETWRLPPVVSRD